MQQCKLVFLSRLFFLRNIFCRATELAFIILSISLCIVVPDSTFYVFAIMCVPCASLFSSPKLLFWQRCRKTYLAHLLQCVFWLALLSIDGMSARGRENGEKNRQTEGGRWGKPTLWLRGEEVREFPDEQDGFYICLNWMVAWSSAAPHSLVCSREKSALHILFNIEKYGLICNSRTSSPSRTTFVFPLFFSFAWLNLNFETSAYYKSSF